MRSERERAQSEMESYMAKAIKWDVLLKVSDWPQLAHRAEYNLALAAGPLNVSVRYVETFFGQVLRECPHAAFARWRLIRIRELRSAGKSGDEIAKDVSFANRQNLARFIWEQ